MKKISDWKFKNIADTFDSHVREQLPWYDLVLDTIVFTIKNVLPTHGMIYDIGGSTGNIGKLLHDTVVSRNATYISIDNVPEMKPTIIADATEYSYRSFDVAILNLTMMFIPVKDRQGLLQTLYNQLEVGGVIIIVDKFIQPESYMATIFRRITLQWKYNNGVDAESIITKELSLSGIQIPLYESELADYEPYKFFQLGEFSGYIITKKD